MAINFLIFCTSIDGLAWVLGAGAVGFGFSAGVGFAVGRVYTGSRDGSGLLVAWVVGF